MSRLEVKTPDRAQAVVEQIYRNMERRIAASPPGLCPVDMALNSLDLCRAQTCGKCVPCRIGLTQLSDMLSEILDGEADMRMLRHLEETAQVIVDTADCAIGIDAANLLQLQGRGLAGVAVVSAIFAQADPCAASRELCRLAGQL